MEGIRGERRREAAECNRWQTNERSTLYMYRGCLVVEIGVVLRRRIAISISLKCGAECQGQRTYGSGRGPDEKEDKSVPRSSGSATGLET